MMRTRRADGRTAWRCVPLILSLCLCAAPALAQVPQTLIDRLAELNVQQAETDYLRSSEQIDRVAASDRSKAIDAEQRTLGQQFRQFSPDQQRQANSQIDGLTKARL